MNNKGLLIGLFVGWCFETGSLCGPLASFELYVDRAIPEIHRGLSASASRALGLAPGGF